MNQKISWLLKAEKATEKCTALIVNWKAHVNSSTHVQQYVKVNVTLETCSNFKDSIQFNQLNVLQFSKENFKLPV